MSAKKTTESSIERFEWKCPKCGMTPEGCKKQGDREKCQARYGVITSCMGFICECEDQEHGYTLGDSCPAATCYHCGWGGTFPQRPKKLPPWAKKALDEGWNPPKGWTP